MVSRIPSTGGVFLRRACKLGNSSLVVSLPKAWTQLVGLSPGDWLQVRPRGLGLSITPRHTSTHISSHPISVRLDDVHRAAIEVFGRYVQGFETIVIENTASRRELDELLRLVDKRLMSVQVIKEEDTKVTLQVFSREEPEVLSLLRRLRFVMQSLITLHSQQLRGEQASPQQVEALIRSGFKLYFLGLRRLYNADRLTGSDSETYSWPQLLGFVALFRNIGHVMDALEGIGESITSLQANEARVDAADIFALSTQMYLSCMEAFLSEGAVLDYGYIRRMGKQLNEQITRMILSSRTHLSDEEFNAFWHISRRSLAIADRAISLMEITSDIREHSTEY